MRKNLNDSLTKVLNLRATSTTLHQSNEPNKPIDQVIANPKAPLIPFVVGI